MTAGVESDVPASESFEPVESDPRRWAVLGVLCLALLIVGIDGTIVNVALPTLVVELEATTSELQWIVDAYTIIFAGFLLIAGNTGDRHGRKLCLVLGLVIFGAGSLACSQVDDATHLILFRAVQGFGAALIMPATLSIITNVFADPNERAKAISIWAGVSGLGVAIGPLAGGYLLEHFWWGSIFLVNVPIVIVAIVLVLAIITESRDEHAGKLDLIGTFLSTVGLIALLFGIIEGPARGWTEPLVLGAFAVAVVLLTAFVVWERRIDYPILDVNFFRNPRFTAASIAVTLVFFAMFGSMFFLSQYLQFVLGYSAFESGVALLPIAGALMVAAPLSAVLVGRIGTKIVVAVGLGFVALALVIFSFATVDSGYPLVAVVLVVIGVGMGLAMAPATDSIMGSLPPEKAGVGSAVNDTTREVGGALGVAILGSITAAVYSDHIVGQPDFAQLQEASPEAAEAVSDSVGAASVVAAELPEPFASTLIATANDAFVHAMDRTVIVGAVVAVAGALVALKFLPARAAAREDPVERLIENAALRLTDDPAARRSLSMSTLDLFADAGMSSLSFNAISARSGIATNALEHYWTSRVDAVADSLAEVYDDHQVPDTGDLRADLTTYLDRAADVLIRPRARQVLGAVITAAANDAELDAALRHRLVGPRRAALASRLEAEHQRLRVPLDVALERLAGPVYFRTLLLAEPADRTLIDSTVDSLLVPDDPQS